MFDWFRRHNHHTAHELQHRVNRLERSVSVLIKHIDRKDREVAANLTKLNTAVARLESVVASLPPDNTAEADALAARIDTVSDTLQGTGGTDPAPEPTPTPT